MLWTHHQQAGLLASPDLLDFYGGRVFVECVFLPKTPTPLSFFRKEGPLNFSLRDFDGSLYHQSIGDRHEKMVLSIVDVTKFKNPLPASAELNFNTWAFFQSVLFVFIFAGSENRFPKMICKKIKSKERAHSIRKHHLIKTCIVRCKNDYNLDNKAALS